MAQALCVRTLSQEALREELRALARQCPNAVTLQAKVAERLPGVAVTSCHHGPFFMGMTMSFYHSGVIRF